MDNISKESCIRVLEKYDRITLPAIQLEGETGYAEAKELLDIMQKFGLVGTDREGESYSINQKLIKPRELSDSQIERLANSLFGYDLFLMEEARSAMLYIREEKLEKIGFEEEIAALVEKDILHCFNDQYYLSISDKTFERLCDSYAAYSNITELACIANPILINAIRKGLDADEMYENPFFSKTAVEYVKKELEKYKQTQKMPRLIFNCNMKAKLKRIEDLLISNFFENKSLGKRDEYSKQAEVFCEAVLASGLFPDRIKECVWLAMKKLQSINNMLIIRRYRKMRDADRNEADPQALNEFNYSEYSFDSFKRPSFADILRESFDEEWFEDDDNDDDDGLFDL